MTDYLSAYDELLGIEPAVAYVSLSLIPGEMSLTPQLSIASEVLIGNKIPSAPHQKVKDAYAEKLLKYKDFVEVEYTANYIDNDSELRIIRDKAGLSFVHYLIEPEKLTFEKVGSTYRSNLEVSGKIADLEGNTVYQYQRTIPIEFDREQLDNIRAKLFSFQDMFPVVEGNYKLNVLIKNTVSKEFTSIEKDLSVPPPSSSFQISALLLANRVIRNSEYAGKNKPFLVGDIQLVPSPRNDFSQGDRLYLYFQIHGLPDNLRERGAFEYSILKDENKVHGLVKNIKDYQDRENFFEEFSLADLAAAYYKIKVSLLDEEKKEILFEQSNFYISHLPNLPRPWILSIPQPSSQDPIYANILGNQLLNKKDMAKAKRLLNDAYQRAPNSKKFALDFCRVLFLDKNYQKVKEVASPFLKDEQKYEFLPVVGQASQSLGELAEAIAYYKEYLAHYGANLFILNSIGDCYYRLGNAEEALIAYEKSLELNPDQEKVRKIVDTLKEKK